MRLHKELPQNAVFVGISRLGFKMYKGDDGRVYMVSENEDGTLHIVSAKSKE